MALGRRSILGLALVVGMLAASAPAGMAAGPDANPRLNAPNAPTGTPSTGNRIANPDLSQVSANLDADLDALAQQIARTGIKPANTKKAPAAVQAAVALQRSLSPSQQKKLAGIVEKFSDRSTRILAGTKDSGLSGSPASGKAPANLKSQAAALAALNANVDSRIAKVLTRSQYALHRAATTVVAQDVANAANTSVPQSGVAPTSSSSCYYGGYYSSLATLWESYGYLYAYYNYVTYGDTYAYYGYYYSYYAYAYGPTAARYLGAAYFDYLSAGSDWLKNGSNGASTAYTAYYYAYYGYIYNYYSYYYYGHTYAYYAYYYSYYANQYAYYGYLYGYNYCR